MESRQQGASEQRAGILGDPVLLTWIVLGIGLRVAFAARKGWVLDEFHTDYHAQRATLGLLLEGLVQDNHPPLSFLLVRLAGLGLGTSDLALRVPALLAGAVELLVVGALARPFGRSAQRFSVALVVASSLHLDFASQVRMYAPFSLAITAATLGAARCLRDERGGLLLGASAWCAVHLHYHAVWFLGALTFASLGVAARGGRPMATARRILVPLGIAALASLPWVFLGLLPQLEHGLPPGGKDLGLLALGEAFLHLFVLNVRLGGDLGRIVFATTAMLAIVCAGAAFLSQLARAGARARLADHALLLAAVGFLAPAAAFAAATLHARAGFTWHYVLPALPAVAVLAGSASSWRPARAALASTVLAGLALCGLNLASHGTEDFEGAAAWIAARAQPGDAVIGVEYQPPVFPTGRPWDRYGVPLDGPPRLATNGIHLVRPADRIDCERIWLMASSLPRSVDLVAQLEATHRIEERREFGWRPVVELWIRRGPRADAR